MTTISPPKLIALEVTKRCPLKCLYCRAGATEQQARRELGLKEISDILGNIASFSRPIIILTGGEPLTRKDIYDIGRLGTDLGLTMVLATCGQGVTKDVINDLKASGIKRISISIDGATALVHERFRGVGGSYNNAINAAKTAFEYDLPFQINTTFTKTNILELDKIVALAIELHAVSFHPFFLVPMGRARECKGLEMDAGEYENALRHIHEIEQRQIIEIKPTCAPQYHRIAGKSGRGCLAGTGFAFISHKGIVQTCGFLDIECGDLRKNNYDFENIWMSSEILNNLRDRSNYTGKCGPCAYHETCGGCRARAHEINGSYLAEEPYCAYQQH